MHEAECPDLGPICLERTEPPQLHHTTLWLWEVRLYAEYGLLPNVALQAMVPFGLVQTRTTYSDLAGNRITLDYASIHHRNETLVGPRDPQLFIHHGMRLLGLSVTERAGISIPLGGVVPNPYALAALGLAHEHIQFGTGTVDPILALDVTKAFRGGSLAGFAQAQVPLYADRLGYQSGARIAWGLVASSGLGLSGVSFRLTATAAEELAERWDGRVPTTDGNQGRFDLFVGPGATFPFLHDWSVSVDLRARIYGAIVGAQLDLPLVAEVSIGRLFHLENGRAEGTGVGVLGAERGDVKQVALAGEAVPLVGVPEKWTIFDFWAPWCEACRRLEPALVHLAEEDSHIAVRRINIVDFDSPIARRELSGVALLPHVRLLDPEGTIVWEGSGSPEEMLEQVRVHRQGH